MGYSFQSQPQEQTPQQTFESLLGRNLYAGTNEKTYVDKTLAKDTIADIKTIISKPKLTDSELLELVYYLGSDESKLLNLSDWSRYILLKDFTWVRDFASVVELFFMYKRRVNDGEISVNEQTKQIIEQTTELIEHDTKFLASVYLTIGRSSLSLGATGFDTLTRNRFEYQYDQTQQNITPPPQQKGFMGIRWPK